MTPRSTSSTSRSISVRAGVRRDQASRWATGASPRRRRAAPAQAGRASAAARRCPRPRRVPHGRERPLEDGPRGPRPRRPAARPSRTRGASSSLPQPSAARTAAPRAGAPAGAAAAGSRRPEVASRRRATSSWAASDRPELRLDRERRPATTCRSRRPRARSRYATSAERQQETASRRAREGTPAAGTRGEASSGRASSRPSSFGAPRSSCRSTPVRRERRIEAYGAGVDGGGAARARRSGTGTVSPKRTWLRRQRRARLDRAARRAARPCAAGRTAPDEQRQPERRARRSRAPSSPRPVPWQEPRRRPVEKAARISSASAVCSTTGSSPSSAKPADDADRAALVLGATPACLVAREPHRASAAPVHRIGEGKRRARRPPRGSSPPRSGPGRPPGRRPSRGRRATTTPPRTRDRGNRRARRESCPAAVHEHVRGARSHRRAVPGARRTQLPAPARQARRLPCRPRPHGLAAHEVQRADESPRGNALSADEPFGRRQHARAWPARAQRGAPSRARSVSSTTRGACSAKRSRTTNSTAPRAAERRAEAPQSIVRTSSPGR